MKKLLLTTLLILLLPVLAGAAEYNWYFSDDAAGNPAGDDTTGDGSIGTPWKTLSKAKSAIDAVSSSDTVNLYFDRGDTWEVDTGQNIVFTVWSYDPIVNIDAYGSGDRPIFDGGITDFSEVAESGTGGYYFHRELFSFLRNNCSIENIEIKRLYGSAIRLGSSTSATQKADYFTLSDCYIHDIGYDGVSVGLETGASNCTIENNVIHTAMELCRTGKVGWWSSAIALFNEIYSPSINNIVRYNVIYDIYGEGITQSGGIIEYNVIGDTGSVGIYPVPSLYDAEDVIVRYNLVIQSSSSTYRNMAGSGFKGIVYFDENSAAGDNSNATIEIYGNIIINRQVGIKIYNGDGLGEIRVYNNTIIDSSQGNFVVDNVDEFNAVYIYNNSSILYDRTGATHAADYSGLLPHVNWTIDNNHFWTTGGSPTVDGDWDTNYVTTDPKILGEPTVDWDGQTGATYFSDIDFNTHLYLDPTSGLIDTGKTLGVGYNNPFLTTSTDFGDLPTTATFETVLQGDHGTGWDIGAVIYKGAPDDPPNMTHYSKFDDGALLRDEITDNDTFWTDNGTVDTDTTNKMQGTASADFDDSVPEYFTRTGTTDDFGIGTNASFTICAWARRTSEGTLDAIMHKGSTADDNAAYSIQIKDDASVSVYIGYGVDSDAWEEIPSGNSVVVNQWYWICWAHTVSTKANLIHIFGYTEDAQIGDDYVTPSTNTLTGHNKAGNVSVGANPAGLGAGDLKVDKLVIYDRALDADEMDNAMGSWDAPGFTNSTAPKATYSTAGDTVTITITTNVEAWVENGLPYGTLETGDEDAIAYYTGKTATTQTYVATLTAGMRTTDLVWKDASITLPAGCTMTAEDETDFALTLPDAGAITNATVVAVPNQWIISSGYDFNDWDAFIAATYSVPRDEFIVNFTGNFDTDNSGTKLYPISITGEIDGDAIFDEMYWTIVDLNVTGAVNISNKHIVVE